MKAVFLAGLLLLGLLVAYSFYGNSSKHSITDNTKIRSAESKRLKVDRFLLTHANSIIVLVKVHGKSELLPVNNEDWPNEIEYTYNILKDSNGKVILISQIPYDESGDGSSSFKHYFDEQGDVFAVVKDAATFNDRVEGGVVRERSMSYYDHKFKLIDKKTLLMDVKFKPITGKLEEFDFSDDQFSIYRNVNMCLAGYHIEDKLAAVTH